MRTNWMILVVVLVAAVVPAQARRVSGGSGWIGESDGGSSGRDNSWRPNDPTFLGTGTSKDIDYQHEENMAIIEMEKNRREAHYSELPKTDLGQKIVSIKLAQQAVEAQKSAETKSEEALKKVADLEKLCSQLKEQNESLVRLLNQRDKQVADLLKACDEQANQIKLLRDYNGQLEVENARLRALVPAVAPAVTTPTLTAPPVAPTTGREFLQKQEQAARQHP